MCCSNNCCSAQAKVVGRQSTYGGTVQGCITTAAGLAVQSGAES